MSLPHKTATGTCVHVRNHGYAVVFWVRIHFQVFPTSFQAINVASSMYSMKPWVRTHVGKKGILCLSQRLQYTTVEGEEI